MNLHIPLNEKEKVVISPGSPPDEMVVIDQNGQLLHVKPVHPRVFVVPLFSKG